MSVKPLCLLACLLAAAGADRVNRPLLSLPGLRASSSKLQQPQQRSREALQPYAVLALLGAAAAEGSTVLNGIFGTAFPGASEELDKALLFADLCAPLQAGAPALLFLAAGGSATAGGGSTTAGGGACVPLAALAAADVWLAVVPMDANVEARCEQLCAQAAEALAQLEQTADVSGGGGSGSMTEGSAPARPARVVRRLLLLIVGGADESPPDSVSQLATEVTARLERCWREVTLTLDPPPYGVGFPPPPLSARLEVVHAWVPSMAKAETEPTIGGAGVHLLRRLCAKPDKRTSLLRSDRPFADAVPLSEAVNALSVLARRGGVEDEDAERDEVEEEEQEEEERGEEQRREQRGREERCA